ncbi:MAG: hypothetical protein ACI4JS_05295 [Oscillospiraceae bacterium]
MMNNYKKLFEQISPRESDEVLISKLMARKAENMKDNDTKKSKNIFLKKAVAIPAAAVLAIGAATVSVGATNDWNYAKAFEGMFAQKYEGNVSVNSEVQDFPVDSTVSQGSTTTTSTTTVTQKVEYTPEKPIGTFDFEKYGKKLGIVMNGDGLTATLDGMLVYDDLCYIMYTTTASDELLAKTGGVVPGLRIDFSNFGFKIDGKIAGGMGYTSETISQEGNTRTGCIEITYNSVDLAGKTLNADFLSVINIGGNSTTVLSEHKDIPIDFTLSENIEKELSLKLKTNSFDGEINKVKVSGFRAMLFFKGIPNVPNPMESLPETDEDTSDWTVVEQDALIKDSPSRCLHEEIRSFGNAVITLKDGTTVAAGIGTLSNHGNDADMTGEIELRYTYPVNPSDVTSIKFGDYIINL